MKKFNPKRTMFPYDHDMRGIFSNGDHLKTAERELTEFKEFIVDERVTNLYTLIRFGLKVPESKMGDVLFLSAVPKNWDEYRWIFDGAHREERDELDKALKQVNIDLNKIKATVPANFEHSLELKAKYDELLRTRTLLETKRIKIPKPNHVDPLHTWRRRLTKSEARKKKYARDGYLMQRGIKLRDYIWKRRDWLVGRRKRGLVLTEQEWMNEWRELEKRL